MKETYLRSFPTDEEARDFALRYAGALAALAETTNYGVRVARLPGGDWAVYLRDREAG